MSGNEHKEKPEVYAIRRDGGDWQISRRDFLKAAGLGAAVMGIGMSSRFVKPANAASDLETLCKTSLAHQKDITGLMISADGKYLLSRDTGGQQKCWDFNSHALLQSEKSSVSGEKLCETALLDGKQIALMAGSGSIRLLELPDLKSAGTVKVNPGSTKISEVKDLDADSAGNLCGVSSDSLFILNKNDSLSYTDQKVLFTRRSGTGSFHAVKVLADGSALFLLNSYGFGIFDVRSEKMSEFGTGKAFGAFAVLPGGARALLCEENGTGYQLTSLIDGSVIWEKDLDQDIVQAAVTPDGAYGILAGMKKDLVLVDLADGKVIDRITAGDYVNAEIAVTNDGTAFAAAAGKSILFISLPDFEILGCPVDLKEMKDDTKGIEIKGTDPATGRTITYTLPCGSPIPAGAVCVCNCVAGSVCSCVGHTVCTCDTVCSCVGNTICTCDTVCSCVGNVVTTSHYWHPN